MASTITRSVYASADIIGVVVSNGGWGDISRVLVLAECDNRRSFEAAGVDARRWKWPKKKRAIETEFVEWVEGNPYSR